MTGHSDQKDQKEARTIAIVLIALVVALGVAALLLLPALSGIAAEHLSPGLGLKNAAIISFFLTITLMIVFAIAAGDGIIGEIQFMLGSFFVFFSVLWLLLAWVF
jgi:hypothetical protein